MTRKCFLVAKQVKRINESKQKFSLPNKEYQINRKRKILVETQIYFTYFLYTNVCTSYLCCWGQLHLSHFFAFFQPALPPSSTSPSHPAFPYQHFYLLSWQDFFSFFHQFFGYCYLWSSVQSKGWKIIEKWTPPPKKKPGKVNEWKTVANDNTRKTWFKIQISGFEGKKNFFFGGGIY